MRASSLLVSAVILLGSTASVSGQSGTELPKLLDAHQRQVVERLTRAASAEGVKLDRRSILVTNLADTHIAVGNVNGLTAVPERALKTGVNTSFGFFTKSAVAGLAGGLSRDGFYTIRISLVASSPSTPKTRSPNAEAQFIDHAGNVVGRVPAVFVPRSVAATRPVVDVNSNSQVSLYCMALSTGLICWGARWLDAWTI